MKAISGHYYEHYKNKQRYLVLHIGVHTETGEEMVVYEGQYDDTEFGQRPVWIRPRKMFEEEIIVDGKMTDRFIEIA